MKTVAKKTTAVKKAVGKKGPLTPKKMSPRKRGNVFAMAKMEIACTLFEEALWNAGLSSKFDDKMSIALAHMQACTIEMEDACGEA